MDFTFQYKVKPGNLWVLSMINIYRSMLGLVNVIFTVSMGLLVFRFWSDAHWNIRILIVAGLLLYPVLQPLLIYLRSRKIVSKMPENLEMKINSEGITMESGNNSSHMKYSDIKSVFLIREMVILYTQSKQGFILNKEALDDDGKKLYDFLSIKVGKKK